jgi:hypothetical protein
VFHGVWRGGDTAAADTQSIGRCVRSIHTESGAQGISPRGSSFDIHHSSFIIRRTASQHRLRDRRLTLLPFSMNLSVSQITLCVRIFQGLAISGFLLGCYLWASAWTFYSSSVVTTGLVTNLVQQSQTDGPPTYAPTVQFLASNGTTQTFTSRWGTSPNKLRSGAAIQVRYRSNHPADASVDDFMSLWGLPLLVQGICVFDFFFAAAFLYFIRKGAEKVAA